MSHRNEKYLTLSLAFQPNTGVADYLERCFYLRRVLNKAVRMASSFEGAKLRSHGVVFPCRDGKNGPLYSSDALGDWKAVAHSAHDFISLVTRTAYRHRMHAHVDKLLDERRLEALKSILPIETESSVRLRRVFEEHVFILNDQLIHEQKLHGISPIIPPPAQEPEEVHVTEAQAVQ